MSGITSTIWPILQNIASFAAQELLRASMGQNIRETEAITELQCDLDRFLAAYGVDGETDLRGYKG